MSCLLALLNHVSNGRFGESRACNKAKQLKESASNTFGISVATDVFKLQMKLLLEQIESMMIEISHRQEHFLTTIIHRD